MLGSVIWYGWPLPSALEVPSGAISAYERSVSAFPYPATVPDAFPWALLSPPLRTRRERISAALLHLFPIFSTDAALPDSGGWKGKILFWLPRAGGRWTGLSKGPAPPFVAVAGQAREARLLPGSG